MNLDGETRIRLRVSGLIYCGKKIRFGYQFSLVVRKLKKVKYSAAPSLYMVYSEVCEKLFIFSVLGNFFSRSK